MPMLKLDQVGLEVRMVKFATQADLPEEKTRELDGWKFSNDTDLRTAINMALAFSEARSRLAKGLPVEPATVDPEAL